MAKQVNWQKANWQKVLDARRRRKPHLKQQNGRWYCMAGMASGMTCLEFHLGSGATPLEAYLDREYK